MSMKGRRMMRAVFVLPVACTMALLAQPQSARALARVTTPIDETDRVVLDGGVSPLARAEFDRGAAPDNLPAERMLLVLQSSAAQQRALAKLLAQQKNPRSPNFHHWLTPQEFGQQFGVSPEDLAKVESWLSANGFRIDSVAPGRRTLEFSGTAGQVRAAFQTPIHKFVVDGKQHWANTKDPQIPRALSPVVAGIRSLNSFQSKANNQLAGVFRRNPDTRKVEAVSGGGPQFTFNPGGGDYWAVGPTDFATIYNVAPLWDNGIDGTGQTIAIVQRTNIHPQDVADFRALFGLPANPPTITLNGPDPGITPDESEALIDVEWSGAVAKGATINLIVSASTNTTDGVDLSVDYAVQNNVAPIMSTSFGLCELFLGNAGNAFYASEWQQAAAQGITSLVSTGDSGSAGCDDPSSNAALFGFQVNGLASTPYNVAVGGTDFRGNIDNPDAYWSTTNDPTTKASALSYIPEMAWNDSCASNLFPGNVVANCNNAHLGDAPPFYYMNLTAGSGGKSSCVIAGGSLLPGSCIAGYAKPSWQAASGVPVDSRRDIPDVSLFASNGFLGSFYVVCQSDLTLAPCDLDAPFGHFAGFGGTSVASPAFAGIIALVNQSTDTIQGNANYDFYRLAKLQTTGKCNSTKGPDSSCIFNDVTNGNNEVPCVSPSWSCLGNDIQGAGVLQAYKSGRGYDRATGLGSVNVANLVESWPTSTAAFASATYTVSEAARYATITVNRVGSAVAPLYATWAVAGGTGIVNKDFVADAGSFTLAAGATTGSFIFPLIHDTRVGDRTVELALFPAPGGTPSTATLTLTNVDQPGIIQFRASAVSIRTKPSGATTLTLNVVRGGGAASGVTVDFAAADGTAISPDDYSVVTSPQTLTFASHQSSKRITLQVRRQTHASNPTFTVTLINPGSGATLGATTTETVTIVEH
jgi:subtilase family serine protease